MDKSKNLALAMLAGAQAIRKILSREGGTTYVLDPFNENGMKAEIDYHKAENMLWMEGNKILEELDKLNPDKLADRLEMLEKELARCERGLDYQVNHKHIAEYQKRIAEIEEEIESIKKMQQA